MQKKMSLWGIVSIGIGSMLGAGIFALLGQVVLKAGEQIYLAFFIAGIIAVLSGYSYSKLARLFPTSGGITDYFNNAFKNRFFAGLFSAVYLSTLCISIAMLGRSFGIYAVSVFDVSHSMIAVFSIIAIAFLGIINVRSSDIGRLEIFLVALKLSILMVLIIATFYQYFMVIKPAPIDHSHFSVNFWKSVSFAFFAYAGYGVMTNAAGDVQNPKRTIPQAIFIAIFTIMAIYIALAFVVMKYAPIEDLEKNVDTAITVASKTILGKEGFFLISVAALIAILSGINALFYSSYKIMTKMCEDKELPKFFNYKIFGNGTVGMFVIIISMALASFSFEFGDIATVASSAFLLSYIAVFIANLILFKKTNSSLILILLGLVAMVFVFIQSVM